MLKRSKMVSRKSRCRAPGRPNNFLRNLMLEQSSERVPAAGMAFLRCREIDLSRRRKVRIISMGKKEKDLLKQDSTVRPSRRNFLVAGGGFAAASLLSRIPAA